MKRLIAILLIISILTLAVGCDGAQADGPLLEVPRILSPMEYTLYLNLFYNGEAESYVDNEYTKEGVFGILKDSYSDRDRYYVWGYSDETLCCDWQWELVPKEGESLPAPGSHVRIKGTLKENDEALDGFWLEDASVETLAEYQTSFVGVDATTLSPTLTRVQLVFMCNRAEEFAGSLFKIYGRVMSDGRIQHPYYDNTWVLDVEYDGEMPAIGTWVTVMGTFHGTDATDCYLDALTVNIS